MRMAFDSPLAMSDGEHTPVAHSAIRHECPHAPQLPGSLVMSVQVPLHDTNAPHPSVVASPGGAGITQVVPLHSTSLAQTAPTQHGCPRLPQPGEVSAPGDDASGEAAGEEEVPHAALAVASARARASPLR